MLESSSYTPTRGTVKCPSLGEQDPDTPFSVHPYIWPILVFIDACQHQSSNPPNLELFSTKVRPRGHALICSFNASEGGLSQFSWDFAKPVVKRDTAVWRCALQLWGVVVRLFPSLTLKMSIRVQLEEGNGFQGLCRCSCVFVEGAVSVQRM